MYRDYPDCKHNFVCLLEKHVNRCFESKNSFQHIPVWKNVERASANWHKVSLDDIHVIKGRFEQHKIEYATYCFDSAKNFIDPLKKRNFKAFLLAIDFFRKVLCVIFTDCSTSITQQDFFKPSEAFILMDNFHSFPQHVHVNVKLAKRRCHWKIFSNGSLQEIAAHCP